MDYRYSDEESDISGNDENSCENTCAKPVSHVYPASEYPRSALSKLLHKLRSNLPILSMPILSFYFVQQRMLKL